MNKEYVVTLHRKEDLENFYDEMQSNEFTLTKKRPLSRNTHYMMTETQAQQLREDSRVWGVEAVDSFIAGKSRINREQYPVSGEFLKSGNGNPNNFQWGHIHCAGNSAQRGKGQFGSSGTYTQVQDVVEVFDTGRHVDVVIVDDPVSWDNAEWESPSNPGQSRFVQYQWFNELNTDVNSIDDDNQTEPTGTIVYGESNITTQYHGNHVTGTACGRHYGWAREANIYNIALTDPWLSGQKVGPLLVFDYLRAFHRNKPINPETGKKNPTITNHSYGGVRFMPQKGQDPETEQPIYRLDLVDIQAVTFRGVTYDSNNPGPSGWTESGLGIDFGVRVGLDTYPDYSAAVAADVQDAIAEGIVVIGAAGNDNLVMDKENGLDWNNTIQYLDTAESQTFYYNRGAWPCTHDSGCINVGALDNNADFRRASFSMFGPAVDIYAPGRQILSVYGNTGGLDDTKYPTGQYYLSISGTSMASPQVAGVVACLATGKDRFTQDDAFRYIQNFCVDGDMTFNLFGGTLDDVTASSGTTDKYLRARNPREEYGHLVEQIGRRPDSGLAFPRQSVLRAPTPTPQPQTYTFTVGNSAATDYTFTGTDRVATFSNTLDPTISANAGDTLVFDVNVGIHDFWIKTTETVGSGDGVTTGTITNNGQGNTGTITWDTNGVAPGTYYYICEFHFAMRGSIIIS